MRALQNLFIASAVTVPLVLPTPGTISPLEVYHEEGAMPDNTVTLVLDGDVPLVEFAKAIANFNELVAALSAEVGHSSLDWVIQDLSYSSALASALAIGPPQDIDSVIVAYGEVGTALETDAPIKYQEPVRTAAKKLISISDARIKVVRLQTAKTEAMVSIAPQPQPDVVGEAQALELKPGPVLVPASSMKIFPHQHAFGAVRGRIQTLTNRGGLRFTLYDLLYDKAVSCYFEEGKQELIRDMWGRMAIVEGLVSRDPQSGRPISIRRVGNITPVIEPQDSLDYRDALGAAPSLSGLSPEEAIRKIRDAH